MQDILLVDDERAVLDSLQNALDWSEFGFRHVRTAQSASEAMVLMKEHQIDLLILDILMPGMNGLEMLQSIRAQYPQMHCILISAHSKFEYAREALRLNVENYLLKPVDLNELRETVLSAVENISHESDDLHNLFERNMLERWLYGRITNDELVEHSRFTNYNVLMRRYYAIAVQVEGNADAALRAVNDHLRPSFPAYELLIDQSNGVVLTGGREINAQMIMDALANIPDRFPSIRLVCGSCASSSNEVSKSLADANHAKEYARLAGLRGCIAYDDINWEQLGIERIVELNDLIQTASPEKSVSQWAEQVANHISDAQLPELYAHICLALTHVLEEEAQRSAELPAFSAPSTRQHFLEAVEHSASLLCVGKRERMQALSPIIQLVVKYINENINSSISIKQFCEQRKANAAYIGRMFKEETGMYFSDYVSMLRINKAKLLLETSSFSVSDIARQVGVYDVSYFTQCFKKQVRMSPMKYRQSIQQQRGQ